ncbi:MAG: class I SAM-dependent methyltransferase [Eubacteriales bacterium]|nr:class I SAM-dependent methyltransferase [Eubacteriales bacterium]
MSEIGVVEDTLFVPMIGRIYASEHCPAILYDETALSLKEKLPSHLLQNDRQSQYTLLASASRSANMDRCIREFLERNPEGVIVQLGCGLETAFYRNDNGKTHWYAVDLPDVIAYRKELLPEAERETCIAGDAFDAAWIRQIREKEPSAPILITASGLFYYFTEEKIHTLFRMLQNYGAVEIVFDTVNRSGMMMMRKKYMKEVGHEDAEMFFYVDSAAALAEAVGGTAEVLAEEKYYCHINKRGINLSTRINMTVSDLLTMVKMVHLRLQ